MTRDLAHLHSDERSALQIASESSEYLLNQFDDFVGAQTLDSQPNHGRSTRPGDCQDGVKVRVQGQHDGVLSQRLREDLIIGGLTHPDFPQHEYTHIRGRAGESRRLAELPGPGPGAWACCQSSGVTFRRPVLKIGGGERQRLLNVVRLKFGIVPE